MLPVNEQLPGGKSTASKSLSWHAPEAKLFEHTPDWFWIVGTLAVGGAVLAGFFGAYTFAALILVATGVSFLKATQPPRFLYVELSREGVRNGDVLYPWSVLKSFWVIDTEDHDRIIVRPRRASTPLIVLPYESHETPADDIRDFMLEYLDEEHMEEPPLAKLLERLGF